MRYALDEARYLFVRREGGKLGVETRHREIFPEVTEAEGVIESSLFLAAKTGRAE